MSITSGITFVFGRPFVASTFGENVVWVHAWKWPFAPGCGRSASRSSIVFSSSIAAFMSGSRSSDST